MAERKDLFSFADATPRPWRYDAEGFARGPRVLACDDRATIVAEVTGSCSNPTAQADAALITAAVNAFDESRESTKKALHRLKRRIGKERARFVRIGNDKIERTGAYDDRIHGEINVCDIAIGFIDLELRKIDERA